MKPIEIPYKHEKIEIENRRKILIALLDDFASRGLKDYSLQIGRHLRTRTTVLRRQRHSARATRKVADEKKGLGRVLL